MRTELFEEMSKRKGLMSPEVRDNFKKMYKAKITCENLDNYLIQRKTKRLSSILSLFLLAIDNVIDLWYYKFMKTRKNLVY